MENKLAAPIADAIAAFDAANLTWGQFYQQTVLHWPLADRERALPVREALGDAALSVPSGPGLQEARAFVGALERAHASVLDFLAGCDPALLPGDVQEIPATLIEAADRLRPYC